MFEIFVKYRLQAEVKATTLYVTKYNRETYTKHPPILNYTHIKKLSKNQYNS